jgi:hypothetical protein
MVMTNRDRVDRGMGYLASGLGPFVNELMAAAFPDGGDWVKVLAARNPSRYGAGYQYSLSDPRFLLRVVTEEWRVFKDQLSRVEQGFATELRAAGNRWAHQGQFSDDDTYRTLDTMERLLAAVGAADQASQVRRLRLDRQQPAASSAIPSADAHAERPGRPDQGRSHGTTGFWSAVGRSDVVRAMEEYDRLGQERFLAEHGFGRATAYLLIHGGRSYDSKAILGVAYEFATGVHIGPHEFSGGVSGAAGVLRKLGFEVRDTRTSAGQQAQGTAGPRTQVRRHVPAPVPAHSATQRSAATLDGIPPERSLLVLTCSGRKELGGQPPYPSVDIAWREDLRDARRRVLATAQADTARVLPAWRRYTGAFYQYARPALADAVAAGHVVIISGGYGIVRGDEPIGWYDKVLQLADWPVGLLESALITEARRCGAQTVVAFASATSEYTKLLRRTRWQQAGIDARLVTITGVTGGALREVPRRLGQAFSAFWNRQHDYPPGTIVEVLV